MGKETNIMESKASSSDLSASEAARLLLEYGKYRSFREKLESFYAGDDLRKHLVNGLIANNGTVNKSAVEKRVRNWLNKPRDYEISRQTAIELAFILGLSVDDADAFMAETTDFSFHFRNPAEIVYIYALNNGLSYVEAKKLYDRMIPYFAVVFPEASGEDNLTDIVREEVLLLDKEENLREYLIESAGKLGKYHNRAFNVFTDRMNTLKSIDSLETTKIAGIKSEKKYTTKDVLSIYLWRSIIRQKDNTGVFTKNSGLTNKQIHLLKKIIENWPDEPTFSRIKNREMDVPRKTLILLFLASDDGGESQEDELYDFDERELTPEENFQSIRTRLDNMLLSCGYRKLDAGNPFDCLVLYSISVEAIYEIDERMAAALGALLQISPDE